MITKSNKDTIDSAIKVRDTINELLDNNLLKNIQCCLRDISGDKVFPAIAIEPIETPNAGSEKMPNLTECIINSLLNVYISQFDKTSEQLIKLEIAIPWHRYKISQLDSPQKLTQHFHRHLSWKENNLRKFINQRIAYEMGRVNSKLLKKSSKNDYWTMLFTPKVKNSSFISKIDEDSFRYILRHTHHRARDVLRLTRMCVEVYAEKKDCSPENILKGDYGRIPDYILKEVLNSNGSLFTSERITESERKFYDIDLYLNILRKFKTPFTLDEFQEKIMKLELGSVLNQSLNIFWESGLIGVEINLDNVNHEDLKLKFHDSYQEYKRLYLIDNVKIVSKLYFFEYSFNGELNDLISICENSNLNFSYVLHPMTFEYFAPSLKEAECPIGA